ncbi:MULTISPECIES: UDP-N-acetylglucosamine--undecaprenyl-phosphate N-acetylglucosaminephosphotransferase [unclassified Pseudoalteromonas]|uniref:UDP-N-acetylglucosamine--undecaprenyl-phosphate N-acetylglucosaminephosphotransferase n=1 Tax=unclassified Pseudoalteromonas TaxID=194690 RepID=UPI00110861CF|nr:MULTISPECIES: UDP-N-acetylglucosamine--undecaprenyl-phosphate N-acetylglucosaminephosphotransferase [unclassified Pseudoalteromonas]TMN78123.1 undecaprenyl-phosphate alpha-N-acetylglucosaminyl 1-phosphate transferase [Pseudoalteromonas sp. S410]TMN90447.1 undecaprenyl-phosphate alpha-N-acetylglucosaminyl 1-phosphate transferase [Pseudoalteromonas sp. S408]TMN96473.1 undecaprenyl-phosphate alpha-N-acetylglucosaminyl 1-phosphate transferase [Pseudoalteromonas sp. S407]TMO00600.1 undecaprenyl-p
MIIDLLLTFIIAFAMLFLMRKVARNIGLVDKPSGRKAHTGNIPLVGGVAICITIVHYIYNHPGMINHDNLFMLCIIALTSIGVLDDKYDLSVKFRIAVQTGISLVMIYFANAQMQTLGNMFGMGEVILHWAAPIVTIFAVIGCINAFNMVDGIDGLLGGLSIVTFGSLAILLSLSGETRLSYLCILLVVTMIPYIIINLGFFGRARKVFMGDAGSMMIGFTVIWLLIGASQNPGSPMIRPVTALWLIAVPLMDMVAIMVRRIKQKKSPFKPDREHLHHICQRIGCSSMQTLALICFIASVFAGIGMLGEVFNIPEYFMFYSFIIVFSVYLYALANYCKVINFIRRKLDMPELVIER